MNVEVMVMEYYGHTTDDGRRQLLIDHLTNTAAICAQFALDIGLENSGKSIGLLHDTGKYSYAFQQRLLNDGPKCDHSTAGARIITQSEPEYGKLWAYPIAGHHGGLMDWGSKESGLDSRLTNKNIPDYSAYQNQLTNLPKFDYGEIDAKLSPIGQYQGFKTSFLVRMLYSCLVDADFLETECFMEKEKSELRTINYDINTLLNNLRQYLKAIKSGADDTPINRSRQTISEQCYKFAKSDVGLFSLTVPTGGGKTLSSMLFALEHAIHNRLKRVIIVIPYTSIIEQNAQIYRDIFGKELVLEHHSNFSFEPSNNNKGDSEYTNQNLLRLKYASENWDIAITITTNVQFFESLFASKSSRSRKVHNMANAVIVVDEAQMMPFNYIKPCLLALDEIVTNYNSTVVLSTATQPTFPKEYFSNEIVEIIDNPQRLYEQFRRTKIVNLGQLSDIQLTEYTTKHNSYMIVVNLKEHARVLYKKIVEQQREKRIDTPVFHLTAAMCAKHRTETLKQIKYLLENNMPCILIATNLVECGVDISFPIVYREYSGLDSFIQTAGRCNRNGEIDGLGSVYLFESSDYPIPKYVANQATVSKYILKNYDDPLSLQAINDYFARLYSIDKAQLDSKNIIKDCFESGGGDPHYMFMTAAERFKIIESETYNVIIPYNNEAQKLIDTFRFTGSKKTLRALQPYIVHIYEKEKNELIEQVSLEQLLEGLYILRDRDKYNEAYGLNTEMAFLEI